MTADMAARKVQGVFRSRKAMRKLRAMIRKLTDKVYDAMTGQYFYRNRRTGEIRWASAGLALPDLGARKQRA